MRIGCIIGLALAGCAGGGEDGVLEDSAAALTSPAGPLLEALQGIWRGPTFTIDLAATPDGRLFGRTGQPPADSVRLLFGLTEEGATYRFTSSSGGEVAYTAELVEQAKDGTWRFCAAGGCDALEVAIVVDGGTLSLLTTQSGVRGFSFDAERLREVPDGRFTVGTGEEPDPVLPTLTVETSWVSPENARVVVAVARERCQSGCVTSRVSVVPTSQSSTSEALVFPELHPGTWYVTAFLDRNGNANAATSFQPDGADLFALPDQEVRVEADQTLRLALDTELP